MTVGTQTNVTVAQGNGVTTTFSYNFPIADASEAVITYTNASGTKTILTPTQYTITGIGGTSGGTVVYPLSGSPIASGTTLTIQRIVPLTQTTSVANQGPTFAAIEEGMDDLEYQIQQISSRTSQYRGAWQTATDYQVGDVVQDGMNGNATYNWYMCALANTSGVWATDLAAGDWALALQVAGIVVGGTVTSVAASGGVTTGSASPITTSGTVSFFPSGLNITASAASASFYLTGFNTGSASAYSVLLANLQTNLANAHIAGEARGDIIFRGATNWSRLGGGTSGYVLQTGGTSADPSWTPGPTTKQIVKVSTATFTQGTTAIPYDDTPPQKTEGDELFTLAITPLSASSTLIIDAEVFLTNTNGSVNMAIALFKDADSDAIAVAGQKQGSVADAIYSLRFRAYIAAGSTAARTYKLRFGSSTGATTNVNGGAGREYGGVLVSSMSITEATVS